MAETVVEDQDPFRCSICLEPLRDPVTIPCGHNYCMNCISGCWDQESQKDEFSCPQCRETFSPRPVLKKNTMLAELSQMRTNSRCSIASPTPPPPLALYAEPGDVECDFCSEKKLKAVKSCLVCLLSLCETHVEPHYNVPALKSHKLVQASRHLQQKICSQHDRLIEVFCRTDQKCICMLCIMDEHKGHETVSAAAERKVKETELGKTRTKFQQRIQNREKELQEIQEAVAPYQRSAQEAEHHSEKIFKEFLQTVERRRSEVKELIRAQQKAAVKDAEDVLEILEQELAELRRGHAEWEKLSLEEDHVHFLQSFQVLKSSECKPSPSISLSPRMSFNDLNKSLSALKSEVDDLCKKKMIKISGEVASVEIIIPQEPKTREDFLKCK
ncbi:E3 ubiquitin-protein ligase TRIM47-like [Engraulis encrasicolus]|uniref:E3 ubiquitin-protein ligase TRIM47-like n=1 Tax=Engraulis encrasicolus TaxID=184585 RepID=UPI002FCF0624